MLLMCYSIQAGNFSILREVLHRTVSVPPIHCLKITYPSLPNSTHDYQDSELKTLCTRPIYTCYGLIQSCTKLWQELPHHQPFLYPMMPLYQFTDQTNFTWSHHIIFLNLHTHLKCEKRYVHISHFVPMMSFSLYKFSDQTHFCMIASHIIFLHLHMHLKWEEVRTYQPFCTSWCPSHRISSLIRPTLDGRITYIIFLHLHM